MVSTEAYFRTKWILDPSSCLATTDMDQKVGAAVPLSGELRPHLIQCGQGRGLYLHTKFHLDPSSRLATTDMGGKLGCVPFLGGAGSSSNTIWPGPRDTSMLSFILIHPTVWSKHANATDRTDRTDRQTDRQTDRTTVR